MHWNPLPNELTTSATDVILALLNFGLAWSLLRSMKDKRKGRIWAAALMLLGLAAATGAVRHGFAWDEGMRWWFRQPLNLCLGLAMGLFVTGMVYDLRRASLPRYLLPGMLFIGLLFYAVTLTIEGSFIVFIAYEATALLTALCVYLYLGSRKQFPGAYLMAGGIVVSIAAAVIQATKVLHFTLIWEFDHNGVFHLVQLPGVWLLYAGVRRSEAGK